MSESSAFSIVVDTVGLIARNLVNIQWSWYLAWLIHILALPWKVLLVPLSFFAHVLLVIFAPILYMLSYILSWARQVMAFLVSLEVSRTHIVIVDIT